MTKQETAQVMAILKVAFPNWYRELSREEAVATVNLWHEMFADEPAEEVYAAVKALIATQEEAFPPTVGRVKVRLAKLREPEGLTADAAWAMVYKAACNSAHNSQREFAKLPPEVQSVVGSSDQLRDWALMDAQTFNSVVASNFQKAFKVRSEAAREYKMLPGSVRAAIGNMTERMALEAYDEGGLKPL